MNDFPFTAKHRNQGQALIKQGRIKNILFSQGTYQVEIEDTATQEVVWPFLQLDDHGHLRDSFCTCDTAEKEKSCPHLAAAFLMITKEKPLHIRLRSSLWNILCLIAFKRYGTNSKQFNKKKNIYTYTTPKGKELFSLKFTTQTGEKWLDESIIHRAEETEETSLKFSSLSAEELALWKEGSPSEELQYELSFWSDLAKWMLSLQECQAAYSIDFTAKAGKLPTAITAAFPDFCCTFELKKDDWKKVIPALQNVNSPLKTYASQTTQIKKASYRPDRHELQLTFHKKDLKPKNLKQALKIGDWELRLGEGFFPIEPQKHVEKKTISAEKLAAFLTEHTTILTTTLVGTVLEPKPITPSYELFFDSHRDFHIRTFVFKPGDLHAKTTALFLPWVYLADQGFFKLNTLLFEEIETVIPTTKVEEFINEHRLWLNQCPGFELHLSPIDFQLNYSLDKEKTLRFESEVDQLSAQDQVIELDNWLYVRGKGFYKRQGVRHGVAVVPGMSVERTRISSFIHANSEELEQVKDFFAARCPVEKANLTVNLNDNDIIIIEPHYVFSPNYRSRPVELFGDFTYVPGEGFAEIPQPGRLPEKYQRKVAIEDHKDSLFIAKELPKIEPFIAKIDRRLCQPQALELQVKQMHKDNTNLAKPWIVDLVYTSEWCEEDLKAIKESLNCDDPYATTKAGLLFLDDPRFNWLREFPSAHFSPNGTSLMLSTLEWIRLRVFEHIQPPSGEDQMAIQTRTLIRELDHFEPSETLNLKGLKSSLRPYQEIGVKWLWFLYSYGLSGLLCDDMGLGKTHQAMALLAAARNLHPKRRCSYLIVCPTSVLYHWEELLSQFLPKLAVTFFYGAQRSLASFRQKKDILLTSYGVLRSEKKMFSQLPFTIAIFDEIQMGKNVRSQTHQALGAVKAQTKIGLTGTPIENRLLELKALFDIVLPGYFPSLAKYREQFIQPIEKYQERTKKALLSELIHPFVLRRKKSEVLSDLPDKIEEIAHCFLSEEQQHLYREACLQSRSLIADEINRQDQKASYLHIFSLFNTLKQICNHPSLYHKDLEGFENYSSGKWDLFIELITEARNSGQKLVVFTQYLGMMKIIEYYLKKNKIGFAAIQGETRNRKSQLKQFREDPACEVFIASLRAVGTGVDLTAASVVIHYDRWWNPAKENQATDRVHRIGQNRGVQVFKLVTKSTVEDHIHQLILKKTGLLEGVVGYDDQDQIKRLSHNDIVTILKQINQSI
ncbi:MAG: DEAD/DEAH box helicase [Chlamydiota bacterium]